MTLNALAAAEAASHFAFAVTGLHTDDSDYDAITHQHFSFW